MFKLLSPKASKRQMEGFNDGFWGREATSDNPFYLQGYQEGQQRSLQETT